MISNVLAVLLAGSLLTGTVLAQNPPQPPGPEKPQEAEKPQEESKSRLSDRPMRLLTDAVPERTPPILEFGPPFLDVGPLGDGFELPTGAVWTPALQVFGTYRTAVQTFRDGDRTFSEWANRLDLFANLSFTGTERILFGIRPLDDDADPFTGYYFSPDGTDGWKNGFDARVETLFFEGEFAEIFPGLDESDESPLDLGFAVGRQPLLFQEGMLIDDTIDAVGITRNTLAWLGASNLRLTALWGWNDVNRNDNDRDQSAHLFGLFSEADYTWTTLAVDVVYVDASDRTGDALFAGASAVQRIGDFNTAFRVLGSFPFDDETSATGEGVLVFGEISLTPHATNDLVYLNAFWGIDRFSSAARAPDAGGALGRVGILFAAVGIGRYDAALGNRPDDSVGAALGWQQFFDGGRRQLTFEAGGRLGTDEDDTSAAAVGARLQQAVGKRAIVQVDAFVGVREARGATFGMRVEFLIKF
ncbi:MAG: hypothetical protein CMJ83_20070 [Planctomycetes bacterium]|nr:hypothetical protein [Planctomycetota bacterium]